MNAENRPGNPPRSGVKSGIDTILRLVPVSDFDEREGDHHRIRVLQVGERLEVLEALRRWKKSSPSEYKRALNGLRKMAGNKELPPLGSIKRVGSKNHVIQIAGDNGRLYCFEDSDSGYTIVCVNTFWIGQGSKIEMQNLAIRKAEEMMARWQNAKPVKGVPDTRTEGS